MSSARIGVPPASVWQWSDGPLIDEFAVRGDHDSKYPAGAATERLSHRNEFGAPALIRTKVASDRVP